MSNLRTSPVSATSPHLHLVRDEDASTYDADPPTATKRGSFVMMPWELYDRLAGDGDAQVVLMALLRHADADGKCWPSIGTLVRITGKSDRHIRAKINRLAELQIITKVPRVTGGMKSVNVYQICQKSPELQIGTPCRTFGTTNRTDRHSMPDGPALHADRTRTIELDTDEREENDPLPPIDFEKAFWPNYPKGRGSKKDARALWSRLSAGDQRAAVDALPVFAAGRDWQRGFHPAPEVWLRGRRWENPPPPWSGDPPANGSHANGKPAADWSAAFAAVKRERGGEPDGVLDITEFQTGGQR